MKNDNYERTNTFINDIEKIVFGEVLEIKEDKLFATV